MKNYRTHPDLARIQMKHKYGTIPEHPTDVSPYQFTFNDPSTPQGFAPLTYVDLSRSLDRFETVQFGGIVVNPLEAKVANDVVLQVLEGRGNENLTNNIFVTAAYNSQVDYISDYFHGPDGCLPNNAYAAQCVKIATIDSLQGKERRVVIVSLTRSNRMKKIGFQKDSRRINVATSRSQHCLIVIGDSSTMQTSQMVQSLWRACADNTIGTRLDYYIPPHNRLDKTRGSYH